MKNMNCMKMANEKNADGKYLLYCYNNSTRSSTQTGGSYQHEPNATRMHIAFCMEKSRFVQFRIKQFAVSFVTSCSLHRRRSNGVARECEWRMTELFPFYIFVWRNGREKWWKEK